MKKIYSPYNIKDIVASIGIFDGVHRGHQKILQKLVREAKRLNRKSLVITFHPHPRKVANPRSKIPFLTSLDHRFRLIEAIGIDYFFVIRFTRSILRMTADDFIKNILMKRFRMKALVVGKDFLFGYKGRGDLKFLKRASKELNFKLFSVPQVKVKQKIVSSTEIRKKIEKGDLNNAALMLGRPVTVLGTVVRGKEIGRKIGFPTANIDPHHEAIPPTGVYAVGLKMGKKIFKGVLNIGLRPTFESNKDNSIELHIIDFKKNLYGRDIEVIFKRKIRNERKFSSIQGLRAQIKRDIQIAKQ